MTEQKTRKWLQSIKTDMEKLQKMKEQVAELRTVAESCTVRTDKERVQSSGSGDKMANIVAKIVETDYLISSLEEDIASRKKIIAVLSKKLESETQADYLKIRYLDCKSFYDTVMIMDLKDSSARRIERKAISGMTRLINDLIPQNLVGNPINFAE